MKLPIKLHSNQVILCLLIVVESIVLFSTTAASANSHQNDPRKLSTRTGLSSTGSEERTSSNANHPNVQDGRIDPNQRREEEFRSSGRSELTRNHEQDNKVVRQQQATAFNGTGEQAKQRGKRQSDHSAELLAQNFADDPTAGHFEPLTLNNNQQDGPQQQVAGSNQQQQQQQKGKRTLYACEEKQLEIECQLGESIQLIRANYGRFSIQICNEHGQLDWKVNCMSPQSFQIISDSCQAKQSCQLLASNLIFGDSCPGTQKYLEVHYQCVPAAQLQSNRTTTTTTDNQANGRTLVNQRPPASPVVNNKNVIQLDTAATTTTLPSNSETNFGRQRWPPSQPGSPAQLPPWIMDSIPLAPAAVTAKPAAHHHPQEDLKQPIATATPPSGPLKCPELASWRGIRWPATEPGLVVQMPCPAHAHSASAATTGQQPLGVADYAQQTASLACLPGGQWAPTISVTHCQSNWLRNLTQRLETGDSLLSILVELVHWTKPTAVSLFDQQQQARFQHHQQHHHQQQATLALFGDDLAQIGGITRRLVDDMGELLARINDDRQRVSFAREMIQLLIELANNLANEMHAEAWLDLAQTARQTQLAERQRIAGQLISSLETAIVLFAGTMNSMEAHQQQQQAMADGSQQPEENFLKITENVFVSIRGLATPSNSTTIDLTFPSRSSSLGTRWTNSEQKFTLHLQTDSYDQLQQQQLSVNQMGQQQQLKVVFIMLHNLGQQMDPINQQQPHRQFIVNSDLVSLSIVAPSQQQQPAATSATNDQQRQQRNNQVKVELSSPVELVFRHQQQQQQADQTTPTSEQHWPTSGRQRPAGSLAPPRCVFWDTNISEWQSDGCKLTATNQTHSVCACNHLTTFALLTEWDSSSSANPIELRNLAAPTTAAAADQQHQQARNALDLPRVQLDNVENELVLANRKALYLAKLLEGNLFGNGQSPSGQQSAPNVRPFVYGSFLLAALLLALQLAAAAYSRAQARRLLGAMPIEPPPPLLVTNNNLRSTASRLDLTQRANNNDTARRQTSNEHSSPSYSSDYSAALTAATKNQLIRQSALDTNNQYDCFQSNTNNGPTYEYDSSPTLSWQNAKYDHHNAYHSQHQKKQRAADMEANWRQLAVVPVHLIVQLLFLQLLLVLLVESQNYLTRSASIRQYLINPASVYFNALASWPSNFFQTGAGITSEPIGDSLSPIGLLTCALVFALFYLISSFTCWLLAQLIRLNASVLLLGQSAACPLNIGADQLTKHAHSTSNSTASSTAPSDSGKMIAQQQQHQMSANNFYGQQQQQAQQHSSISPTSSSYSSSMTAPGGDNALTLALNGRRCVAGQQQQPHLSHLTGRAKVSSSSSNNNNNKSACCSCKFAQLALAICLSGQLNWLLVHICPVLVSSALLWLASDQSQLINRVAYTMSYGTQLAYWPLLVESSWNLPLASLLFCLPAICLALGFMALVSLRRHFRRRCRIIAAIGQQQQHNPKPMISMNHNPGHANPYGTAAVGQQHQFHQHHQPQQQFILNKQSIGSENDDVDVGAALDELRDEQQQQQHQQQQLDENQAAHSLLWQNHSQQQATGRSRFEAKTKRAKFACLTLVSLLALHSICWISFFAHCHQALGPQQQTGQSNLLMWSFLTSNLLIAVLITWTQRKTLRRSAHLAGLTRLLSCLCKGASGRDDQKFARRQRRRLHSSTGPAATCTISGAKSTLKVSPSSQSLFLVSSRPSQFGATNTAAAAEQHQFAAYAGSTTNNNLATAAPSYHYGPAYSSFAQQQQQHLYQQLAASHQHIYDSTSNLNNQMQQEQPLNAVRLMQQQQFHHLNGFEQHQQQQPQQGFHTLNRSQQLHLQPQQQHELQRPTAMTLARGHHAKATHQFQLLSGQQQQQQQQQLLICPTSSSIETKLANQQQHSGEVDGPLVALMNSSGQSKQTSQPPATFGPIHSTSVQAPTATATTMLLNNNSNQQQQEHTEHRLFSGQQAARDKMQPRPISCINNEPLGLGVAVSDANQQQRQYCQQQQQQHHQNYNEALKMALLLQQEQQQQHSSAAGQQQQNFRRANSKLERHRTTAAGNMIDGQIMLAGQVANGAANQQQFATGNSPDRSTDSSLANSIYDVANYAIH